MMGTFVSSLVAALTAISLADGSQTTPPKALDSRLVFERVAAEPEIVTPTGIAVDSRGRVLVIESHTHFRPAGYPGPPADRIRVFEDRNHDGKPECTGTFFEGTKMTMNLRVARDDSVFVATRSALYHLWDRDGDGKADGVHPPASSPRRLSGSTRRATILITACRASRLTSPATSISASVKTWVPTTG